MIGRLTAAPIRLAAVLAVCLMAFASAWAAQEPGLRPTLDIPAVASEKGGQYYILLLKWSRDVVIGPVTARATYLDPKLYLAWMRQSAPDVEQAKLNAALAGFPRTLRFRVAYQAADRPALHAKAWKVTLIGADGAAFPSRPGKRIAPVDLKSGPNGEFWEDDWDYQVSVPDGFLRSDGKGFSLALSGPAGKGVAKWSFGVTARDQGRADGYVVYLGAALTGLSLALLLALYLTRPPRQSLV